MASLDWLFAAVIGAGGSLLGGSVGGWYVLRAGQRQWQRDRQTSRTDRSHQAAITIAAEVGSLEEAVETWKAQRDHDALRVSFNVFSRASTVQSIALTDEALRWRVNNHTLLAGFFSAVAEREGGAAPLLADTVRLHADAVIEALEAHVNDRPLPAYQPPPLNKANALLEWRPQHPDGG